MIRLMTGLCLALLGTSVHAAAWKRAESKHFVIYSQGSDKELLKYSQRLEAVHYVMGLATASKDAGRIVKVRVYLVSDVPTVQRLMGKPNSDIAGYYSATDEGALAVVPRDAGGDGDFTGQVVLFHEYAHHFMLQYSPAAYPAWFVEGFAEIVSTTSFERKGAITYGKAASHRQNELVYADWIPTAKLIDGSYVDLPGQRLGGFYGQAWLLSHYLTFSGKRPGQLRAFITAMNNGKSQKEAAAVFGDLTQLQRELRIYAEGGSFPYKAPPLPAEIASETVITALSAGEGALIEDRIQLERLTRPGDTDAKKAARAAWLSGLRRRADAFPGDAGALEIVADAECTSEEWTACGQTADRLLAVAPTDAHGMLYKGQALLEAKPPKVAQAREWIVKANNAAPDDPQPLIAYYRSFGAEGREAPDSALSGLIQAMQTVPQAEGVRLMLANELIGRGRKDEARIVLEPLAFSPHRSGAAQTAQAMIDRIDGKAASEGPVPAPDAD